MAQFLPLGSYFTLFISLSLIPVVLCFLIFLVHHTVIFCLVIFLHFSNFYRSFKITQSNYLTLSFQLSLFPVSITLSFFLSPFHIQYFFNILFFFPFEKKLYYCFARPNTFLLNSSLQQDYQNAF